MANNSHIKSFTAHDIERYHAGQLSASEMNALEKAALDDPFLADALDGYTTPGVAINTDLAELKKRLEAKTEKAKVIPLGTESKRSFPWLRIAIMLVLIAGAGLLSYQFLFKSKTTSPIAQLNQKEENKEANNRPSPANTATDTLSQPGRLNNAEYQVKINTQSVNGNGNDKGTVIEKNVATGEPNFNSSIVTDSTKKNPAKNDYTLNTESALSKRSDQDKLRDQYRKTNDLQVQNNIVTKQDSVVTTGYGYAKPASKEQAVNDAEGMIALQEKAKSTSNNRSEFKTLNENSYSNPKIFRGRVIDANNNALPFANITNTHDNVGTYSDAKGNFALVSTDSIMNVQVKVVGFENKKINLQNSTPLNQVVMQEDRNVAEKIIDTTKRNYALRSRDAAMKFEEPEPVDGWQYYDSYLANNLVVPEALELRKKDGGDAVEVSFEVNKNGEPVNLKIEKSLCDKCDKEAIRLIKEGPKWKRKAKKGKRTTVTIPFTKTD